MLRNTLRLRELTARQVMVPRTRLIAAPMTSTVIELMTTTVTSGLSRLPLFNEDIDHIIGFVHIKDLFHLHLKGEKNALTIMREAVYVPETLPIAEVWTTLKQHRQYIAIVFDEHGGTAGIITFEDLIEEIFGELQDEFDQEAALVSYDKQGLTHLRADLLVSDLNEYLNLSLPEEVADTLGGLVSIKLNHRSQVGDEITVSDVPMRVEKVEDIYIIEVSLKLPEGIRPKVSEWEDMPRA